MARRRRIRPPGRVTQPCDSIGREPGRSACSAPPSPQASSAATLGDASASDTGTLPVISSNARLVRTSRPLSSNRTMPTGLRSNQSSISRTERSARSRASCSLVVSCSTAR